MERTREEIARETARWLAARGLAAVPRLPARLVPAERRAAFSSRASSYYARLLEESRAVTATYTWR
ncbi:MAG: hypothetical protein AAB368_02125 [bacterium]